MSSGEIQYLCHQCVSVCVNEWAQKCSWFLWNRKHYQFWSDQHLAWQSLHQCMSVCEVLWVIGWLEVHCPFLLPAIPANCISVVQDQRTIIPTPTKAKWIFHTCDRCTVFRKVLQFPSWQLFKPPKKCRERKKMRNSGEFPTHTYTPFLTHSGSRWWMTSCEVLYPSGQPTHCKFWSPQYTSAPEPWKEGEN